MNNLNVTLNCHITLRRTRRHLASLLSQSKKVLEALYREAEVPWDAVEEERGEVKEDERSQVEQKIHEEVWLSRPKPYLEKVRSLLPIDAPRYRVARSLEILTGGEDLLIHRHHKFQVSTLLEILDSTLYRILLRYVSMFQPFLRFRTSA